MAFSRAWQFALGALAFLWSGPGNGMRPKAYGTLGLLMILAAALLLDPKMSYPGLWALLPSLGAALVLQSGSVQSGLGLLSARPMQALGRVSYSWYLWHWPVLLLGATLIDAHEPLKAAALVVASLAIAVVAHRLVESPMRHWQGLRARPAATLLAGTASIAVAWHGRAPLATRKPPQIMDEQINGRTPVHKDSRRSAGAVRGRLR